MTHQINSVFSVMLLLIYLNQFVDCIIVKRFMIVPKDWLSHVEGKIVKWFIHAKKQQNKYVNFDTFLNYLKGVFAIEENIPINISLLQNSCIILA